MNWLISLHCPVLILLADIINNMLPLYLANFCCYVILIMKTPQCAIVRTHNTRWRRYLGSLTETNMLKFISLLNWLSIYIFPVCLFVTIWYKYNNLTIYLSNNRFYCIWLFLCPRGHCWVTVGNDKKMNLKINKINKIKSPWAAVSLLWGIRLTQSWHEVCLLYVMNHSSNTPFITTTVFHSWDQL